MTTTLDGVTLAEPTWGDDGYQKSSIDVGARHGTADGAVHFDYVVTRYTFSLKWKGKTETQKNTAHAEYLDALAGVVAFSPPDTTGTFNVLAVPNSWKESYITDSGGTRYYSFEMQLEEQA